MLVTDWAVLSPILFHQHPCNPFELRTTCSYYRIYIVLKYHDDHHSRRSLFLILSFWWSKMAIYQPKLGCKYLQVPTTGIKYLSVFSYLWYMCSTIWSNSFCQILENFSKWACQKIGKIFPENILGHAPEICQWGLKLITVKILSVHSKSTFLPKI